MLGCLLNPRNRAFIDLDLHVIGDFERKRGLLDVCDQTVDTAAGDDAISGFQVRHQLLMLLLPLLLGADQQKIKDHSHKQKRQKGLQQIWLGTGAGSRRLLS